MKAKLCLRHADYSCTWIHGRWVWWLWLRGLWAMHSGHSEIDGGGYRTRVQVTGFFVQEQVRIRKNLAATWWDR